MKISFLLFFAITLFSFSAKSQCDAQFDYTTVGCNAVYFTPDSVNTQAYYMWNFGDGFTSTDPLVTHSYATSGTYNASLLIIDSLNNCINDYVLSVTVVCDSIPVIDSCNVDFSVDFVTCDSVWFVPSVYNPSAYYQWDMGDGNTYNWEGNGYTYAADGTYLVMLYYIDSVNNCWGIAEHWVTIACDSIPTIDSCNANFDYSYFTCDSVWFMPWVYEPAALYSWNFGDGSVGYGPSTSHQYANDGSYLVTLIIEDTLNNCWDASSYYVTILCDSIPVIDSCNADFDYNFVTCDSVWFTPSMYEPTAFYVWNFGEGSSDHNPFTSHQYTHDGTFVVTLTVVDCMNNCFATHTTTVTVDCDSTLGIQPVTDEKILNVYPNPGTGIFYIEIESEDAAIQVYDLSGNLVVNTTCVDNCSNFALDLSHLANGAYSIVLIDDGDMRSTRIIKN